MFISYLSGGLLGDFIYQLSVINEKYIESGKKGILYLSNKGDAFRNGLENTYKDLYNIIINQDYILDFKIYNNESIDIDLTEWRENRAVDYKNWYIKYSNTYNVNWGKNIWLKNISGKQNEKFENRIIINTTNYRWPYFIDFSNIYKIYGNDLLFISFDINQYNYFHDKTGLNLDFYNPIDFTNLCDCINSCKLFIGSQSALLHVAFAFKKNVIIGECEEECHPEHGHHYIQGLDHYFSKIKSN